MATTGGSAGDAGRGRVARRSTSGSRIRRSPKADAASGSASAKTGAPGKSDGAGKTGGPDSDASPTGAASATGAAGAPATGTGGTGTKTAAGPAATAGPAASAGEATTAGPAASAGQADHPAGADAPGSAVSAGSGSRASLDALAARRVPRTVPPPPGGPLPTTRRGMLRYRVLPRSVVGISMLILAFAIGAGFSGVVLFSYYQFKQNQANDKVNALISGYKGQFAKAESDLNAAVAAAKANIATQVNDAQALQAGPAQLASVLKAVAPSVFFVHTLDPSGQPSVGTAFVVSSNSTQSLLLTSYTTVMAATRAPGPQVFVSQGDNGAGNQTPVTVKTWDPQYDLALLILSRGGLPAISVAPSSPSPQPGDRLYAVSGLGSAGASVAEGAVVDVSSNGLELDAAIGTPFQGGPVVNRAGQVIGVGSRSYAPLGFTSQGTYFVPFVQAACSKVLSCPGGTLSGSH